MGPGSLVCLSELCTCAQAKAYDVAIGLSLAQLYNPLVE
jgi:hypothetical protein